MQLSLNNYTTAATTTTIKHKFDVRKTDQRAHTHHIIMLYRRTIPRAIVGEILVEDAGVAATATRVTASSRK